jgi:hypothetical protein
MGQVCSVSTRLSGASVALLLSAMVCGESWAEEYTSPDLVLQSGHVSHDAWRHAPGSRGLALSFEDRNQVRSAARKQLRRLVDRHLNLPSLSFSDLFPDLGELAETSSNAVDGLFSPVAAALTTPRMFGGLEFEARPRMNLDVDLTEVEARAGLRLQWGRGFAESTRLRGFVYGDWEARAGLDNLLQGTEKTGGHDLDAGLGVAMGNWSLAVETNLIGSGFGDREGHGTTGLLGYAVRF